MDEEMIQAYARLTAHEFALETILTTMLGLMPADAADAWMVEFRVKAQRFRIPDNPASDDISSTKIVLDAAKMIDAFADKVTHRLASVRARSAQGQGRP